MAIVYKGRRRKFVESQHPRNPRTGEFVEKTGGHASWLTRIANRTQGPNIGGKMTPARAGYGPAGTGRVAASSLKKGDHAKVAGVDASGRSMSLDGYVQAASGVNVRQKGRKTPMIAVQMAETPSGGGANWRSTVYVEPGARVQKTAPKADVARLEGVNSNDRDVADVTAMTPEQLDDEIARLGARLDSMGGNQRSTPEWNNIQGRLILVRQEKRRRSADVDQARRENALQERISADIARQRGEVDTSRAKQDDGGMAPTTPAAAPAGTMKIGDRNLTAAEIAEFASTKPAKFIEDYAKTKFPGRQTGRKAADRDQLLNAARNIREGNWTPERAAQDLEGTARLRVPIERMPFMFAAKGLRGELKPKGGTPPAPEPKKALAERVNETIAAYHSSFAPVVTPPPAKPTAKAPRGRLTLAEMPKAVRPAFAAARKRDYAGAADHAAAMNRDDFEALPESLRDELTGALIAADAGRHPNASNTLDRLKGTLRSTSVGTMSPILAVAMMGAPDSKLARNVRGQIGRATRAAGRGQEQVDRAVSVLKTTNDRDEARRALDGLTVAQLKQVYAGLNRTPTATRKADMVDRLVQTTVESRITSQVLRGEGPNSWANDTVTARRAAALAESEKPTALQRLAGGKFEEGTFVPNADAQLVGVKPPFTPLRDKDPNSREGFAASMRQLPGAAMHGTAAELEAGDITFGEAATRVAAFLRSLAGRTMSDINRASMADVEVRLRKADRAAFGLDKPAPVPAANSYASITKRATLLAMLRTRNLQAKRGAPDDDLRKLLADDDARRASGTPAPVAPQGSPAAIAIRDAAADLRQSGEPQDRRIADMLEGEARRLDNPESGTTLADALAEVKLMNKVGGPARQYGATQVSPRLTSLTRKLSALNKAASEPTVTRSRAVNEAVTVQSLASLKRPALLAVARQHGVTLRRGAPEREIAEAIVAKQRGDVTPDAPAAPVAPDTAKLDAQIARLQKKIDTKKQSVDSAMWARKNKGIRIQSATESKRRNELTALEREMDGLKRQRGGVAPTAASKDDVLASGLRTLAGGGFTDMATAPTPANSVLAHSVRGEHIGATVRFTVPDRFGRTDRDKTYEGVLLEMRAIDGGQRAVRIVGTQGSVWMPSDTPVEVVSPRPDTPEFQRYAKALEDYNRAQNAVSGARYANTSPTQSSAEVTARGKASDAEDARRKAEQALLAKLVPPAVVEQQPDAPSAPAGMSPLRLDAQIDAAQRLIEQTRTALTVEEARGGMMGDREVGLRAQLRATERKLTDLRAEKAGRANDEALARQAPAPAASATPIGNWHRATRALDPSTQQRTVEVDGKQYDVSGIGGSMEIRDRVDGRLLGKAPWEDWQRVADVVRGDKGPAPKQDWTADVADRVAALGDPPTAPAPALPWRARDMSQIEARRNAVRDATMFRTEFDALPEDRKQAILTELRQVVASGDTQTIASNRTSMGTTIRGAEAPHVAKARGLLNNFLTVRAPAPDNSVRGRAARLREGDRYALEGATIAELGEIAEVAQFRRPGQSWKRDKAVEFLRNRAVIGDRMPKSYNPTQMAETMRGMDKGQALALLDYVEADFGITKTDMKEIAKELGVTLRNGDKRAMMHALSAAAKDAPGKA